MDSKLLAIDRVTKSFPGVRALDDVSLDLERGEIHAVPIPSGRKTVAERNRPMLRVQDLTAPPQVRSVNFQMAPGEIIGLAGLAGAGQAEVGRAIAGLIPYRSSEITLDGHPAHFKKPWEAMRQGVVFTFMAIPLGKDSNPRWCRPIPEARSIAWRPAEALKGPQLARDQKPRILVPFIRRNEGKNLRIAPRARPAFRRSIAAVGWESRTQARRL